MYKVIVEMCCTKYYAMKKGTKLATFDGEPYNLNHVVLVEAKTPWLAMRSAEASAVKAHPDAIIWNITAEFVSDFDEIIK